MAEFTLCQEAQVFYVIKFKDGKYMTLTGQEAKKPTDPLVVTFGSLDHAQKSASMLMFPSEIVLCEWKLEETVVSGRMQ